MMMTRMMMRMTRTMMMMVTLMKMIIMNMTMMKIRVKVAEKEKGIYDANFIDQPYSVVPVFVLS